MSILVIALIAIIVGLVGATIYRGRAHNRKIAFLARSYNVLDRQYEEQGEANAVLIQQLSKVTSGTFKTDLAEANAELAAALKQVDELKFDRHQREIGVQEIVESYENHNLGMQAEVDELAARELRLELIYAWYRSETDTDIPMDELKEIMKRVKESYPNTSPPLALDPDNHGG